MKNLIKLFRRLYSKPEIEIERDELDAAVDLSDFEYCYRQLHGSP